MIKKLFICLMLVIAIVLQGCAGGENVPSPDLNRGINKSEVIEPVESEQASSDDEHMTTSDETAAESDDDSQEYSEDYEPLSEEEYLEIAENKEVSVGESPMLTFSLKVDTASYRNVVRYIDSGSLPPADAVKIEEMINYFNYDQPLESKDEPFALYAELGSSPFSDTKNLAFVRVKAKDVAKKELPPSSLTFLIDVSGSMDSYDKLPLLQSAFSLLVETLDENDIVNIVVYAGNAGVVLEGVRGNEKEKIMKAIDRLEPSGSTAGGEGINLAYKLAEGHFIKNGNNRVVLATDGDFNVGVSSVEELERLMTKKRESGVYMTILGFGTENLKDNNMETLAKNGNGNYSYIDSVDAAKKVLVEELGSNLFVIADDVKSQVEFNPALVNSYRLIGYENRKLRNEDFEDDKKDAGEIGVGTDVVLMFELETKENAKPASLKYQSADEDERSQPGGEDSSYANELFEVRLRYKSPGESESHLITLPVKSDRILADNTTDFGFAASVAGFGHLLRDSNYSGNITFDDVLRLADNNIGVDKGMYREEFVNLLKKWEKIR